MNEYKIWYYDKDFYEVTFSIETAETRSKALYKAFLSCEWEDSLIDFARGLYVKKLGRAFPIPPSVTDMENQVDEFNKAVQVGDAVRVKLDDGSEIDTVTTHPATVLSGHTPVAWLKDISGCYLLDRVSYKQEQTK